MPLAPKQLALLRVLLESGGRVVSKREILERVWPEAPVSEASLTSCVHGLREALGDRRRRGRYVETVHGRGYRFSAEVERPAPSTASERRSRIAIAPLEEDLASPAYLLQGFAAEVTSHLGRWHPAGIDPIAYGSVARLWGLPGDGRVSRQLDLDFVLAGRLRSGDRELRVRADLVRMRDGVVVWSGEFASAPEGRALLAGEVAEAIAKRLIELRGGEFAPEPIPVVTRDPRSHRAWLRGNFLNQLRTETGLRRSIRCFEQALAWDPSCTAAHVALAEAYLNLGWRGYAAPGEIGPPARAAAQRAMQSDGSHVGALSMLAFLRMFLDWDVEGARDALSAAAHEPGDDDRNAWHRSMVELALGRFDAAVERTEAALEMDPLSPNLAIARITALWWADRLEEALSSTRSLVDSEPEFAAAHAVRASVAGALGRSAEALRAASVGDTLARGDQLARSGCAAVFARSGEPGRARSILTALERRARSRYVSPTFVAIIHAALGDDQAALAWLARARELRCMWLPMLGVDPRLQHLRGDPRLRDLECTPVQNGA